MHQVSCHQTPKNSSLPPGEPITELLAAWSAGEPRALDRLMPLLTDELRRLARTLFAGQPAGHTLQPTALVNELYLRLVGRHHRHWQSRSHFFAFAAATMRNLLVDHARAHRTAKRGSGVADLPLDEHRDGRSQPVVDLIALDEALSGLARRDPRQGRIVELRAFAGLSLRETAEQLGLSQATVSRDWAMAKAWLYRRLSAPPGR